MIKRLIFDVDGTLIRNVDFNIPIKNTLLRLGIYSDDLVDRFIENIKNYEKKYNSYNDNDYLNYFSDVLGVTLDSNFLDIFFDELKCCIPKKNERLIKCINELSLRYDLVLLTNYFSVSQMNRLNNMGIGKYFSNCYGETLIKPNIDSYISACGDYKLSECIIIGDDYDMDVIVPKKLGLNVIYVNDRIDGVICVNDVCDISGDFIEKKFI